MSVIWRPSLGWRKTIAHYRNLRLSQCKAFRHSTSNQRSNFARPLEVAAFTSFGVREDHTVNKGPSSSPAPAFIVASILCLRLGSYTPPQTFPPNSDILGMSTSMATTVSGQIRRCEVSSSSWNFAILFANTRSWFLLGVFLVCMCMFTSPASLPLSTSNIEFSLLQLSFDSGHP